MFEGNDDVTPMNERVGLYAMRFSLPLALSAPIVL